MNKLHLEILRELKNHSSSLTVDKPNYKDFTLKYLGSPRKSYNLKTATARKIARKFKCSHRDLTVTEFGELLDSLYQGDSFDERTFGKFLLILYPKLRAQIPPQKLDTWLNYLSGWCEVDSLCQSLFKFEEMSKNWSAWEKLLLKFNKNKNVSKRRASLVLLTGPARQTGDTRVLNLAFRNIEKVKLEKDILITKAISWLLRDLIKYHKAEVSKYLSQNATTLPKIAVREVRNKLLTGKKTRRFKE